LERGVLLNLQTVESEPGRTAPDHYVSMGHWDSSRAVGPAMTAEEEYRQPEQYGDREVKVPFILVPDEATAPRRSLATGSVESGLRLTSRAPSAN
jgi:hypothetical protein